MNYVQQRKYNKTIYIYIMKTYFTNMLMKNNAKKKPKMKLILNRLWSFREKTNRNEEID